MQLNREQAQCVEEDGHCLVVACPGSGKTRVITQKIAALFDRHPDARICAVTFTRDSANELTERVVQVIGKDRFKKACRIGTFHALAIRQLKNAGLLNAFATPGQQYQLIGRAMGQSAFEGDFEAAAQTIEAAKTSLTANAAQETALYLAYTELLSRQKLVDLWDILRDSVTSMRSGKLAPYAAQFMLVDEFQDTDHIQLAWVMEHAKAGTNITCVGDDDQSIYSWRGALGNAGMDEFRSACSAKLITLGQNYRSRAEILSFADTIIRADTNRIPKVLDAFKGKGGSVSLRRIGSPDDEAIMVADEIDQHTIPNEDPNSVFRKTVKPGSWAVLARSKRYLDFVECELQMRGIQFLRPASDSIWNRTPFVQMLALLKSLQSASPDGIDSALHHALKTQISSLNADQALSKLHELSGDSLSHILDGQLPDKLKTSVVANEFEVIREFSSLAAAWRMRLSAGNYRLVIIGVAGWFAKMESDPDKMELVEHMGEYLARLNGSLNKRIAAATGQNGKQKTKESEEENRHGVVLSTMHAAKGLEFDHTWIVGCNNNVIPSPKSLNLPEERRLLYVAATRPKEHLFLSATTKTEVSPLLTEVGIQF